MIRKERKTAEKNTARARGTYRKEATLVCEMCSVAEDIYKKQSCLGFTEDVTAFGEVIAYYRKLF